MLEKLKLYILNSALTQSIIDVVLTTLIGLFSGVFTIEITENNNLVLSKAISSYSTYLIFFLGVLLILYKKLIVLSVSEVDKFRDEQYCLAYARSQMLPEAARKAVEKIRKGRGGELHDAMEEIKKVLK